MGTSLQPHWLMEDPWSFIVSIFMKKNRSNFWGIFPRFKAKNLPPCVVNRWKQKYITSCHNRVVFCRHATGGIGKTLRLTFDCFWLFRKGEIPINKYLMKRLSIVWQTANFFYPDKHGNWVICEHVLHQTVSFFVSRQKKLPVKWACFLSKRSGLLTFGLAIT